MGEMAILGLLDPEDGPAREWWAVPARELEDLQARLNPADAVELAEDKRHLAGICAAHDLPCPSRLAVLERGPDATTTRGRWIDQLAGVAADDIVIKPVDGHRGEGVRVLCRRGERVADERGRMLDWTGVVAELHSDPHPAFLAEPRLCPHRALRALSGSDALQTLRVVTLRRPEPGATTRVIWCALRIATSGEVVDSFRAGATGNLVALIRPAGVLGPAWGVHPTGHGLVSHARHPETGARLEGVPVPGWDAARLLAVRAAEAFSPLVAVGWDIAITDDGPVIIEANAWWALLALPDGSARRVLAALQEASAGL